MNSKTVSGLLALGFIATACGATYSHEKSVDELVDSAGIDRATAECIVTGMEAEFSEEKLLSDDTPTPEDEAIVTSISSECILGN